MGVGGFGAVGPRAAREWRPIPSWLVVALRPQDRTTRRPIAQRQPFLHKRPTWRPAHWSPCAHRTGRDADDRPRPAAQPLPVLTDHRARSWLRGKATLACAGLPAQHARHDLQRARLGERLVEVAALR